MPQTIIALFKQKTGITEEDWKKICRRYYNRDFTTLTMIISKECDKSIKAVKTELENEFKKQGEITRLCEVPNFNSN